MRTLVRERLVREAERLARAGRRAERFRDQRCVRVDERRSGEPERDQAAGEHYQRQPRQRRDSEAVGRQDQRGYRGDRPVVAGEPPHDQPAPAVGRPAQEGQCAGREPREADRSVAVAGRVERSGNRRAPQESREYERAGGSAQRASDRASYAGKRPLGGEGFARGRSQNAERHTEYGLLHGRTREGTASERDRL